MKKNEAIYMEVDDMGGCCAIGHFHYFGFGPEVRPPRKKSKWRGWEYDPLEGKQKIKDFKWVPVPEDEEDDDFDWNGPYCGGSGLCVANFTNKPECKAAYEELSKKYKILFQSEVIKNSNHPERDGGFFVVFDCRP